MIVDHFVTMMIVAVLHGVGSPGEGGRGIITDLVHPLNKLRCQRQSVN